MLKINYKSVRVVITIGTKNLLFFFLLTFPYIPDDIFTYFCIPQKKFFENTQPRALYTSVAHEIRQQ